MLFQHDTHQKTHFYRTNQRVLVGFREFIREASGRNSSRIVLALDVTGPTNKRVEAATRIVSEVCDHVAAVKVNMHLLLPFGLEGLRGVLSECQARQLPVIADIKLNDIGATNTDAVQTLFSYGVDAVIANPFVGYSEGLSEVLRAGREAGKGVILLVYMSHAGAKEGYGIKLASGKPMYMVLAARARAWRADGAIVSAKSPRILRLVRKTLREDQLIISPGVGAQGGDARKALAAGADFVIVGRSIIESENPGVAARKMSEDAGTKHGLG